MERLLAVDIERDDLSLFVDFYSFRSIQLNIENVIRCWAGNQYENYGDQNIEWGDYQGIRGLWN